MRFSDRVDRIWRARINDPKAKLLLLAINEFVGDQHSPIPDFEALRKLTDLSISEIEEKYQLLSDMGYVAGYKKPVLNSEEP